MTESYFLEPGPVRGEQFPHRPGDPHLALGQHDQVAGDPFQLGQHVRGQHHGDPVAFGRRDDGGEEVLPGHRVERGKRLVEHQQRGAAGQRDRQRELGLLAAGQLADLLAERDLELPEPVLGAPLVPAPVQVAGQVQHVR